MTKISETLYTLVQHSGFGYAGKPGFKQAVEMRMLTRKGQIEKVRKAGGMLFDSYAAASDAADTENYPEEVQGLYPRARGTFARFVVDGLHVYIPSRGA